MRTFYSKAAMLVLGGAAMVVLSACGGSNGVPSKSGAGDRNDTVGDDTAACLKNLGYEFVTLSNGSIWLNKNLGASSSDAGEDYNNSASFGDYYQWGRGNDGHEKVNSETTTTLATETAPAEGQEWFGKFIITDTNTKKTSLGDWVEPGVDDNGSIRSAAWGTPRPDEADTSEPLSSICPCGFVVPSVQDYVDANLTTVVDALGLPIAGYRDRDSGDSYMEAGYFGPYWTRDAYGDGNAYVYVFRIDTNQTELEVEVGNVRGYATPIRCIKKESSIDTPPDFWH